MERSVDEKEYKKLLLEELIYFDDFCTKNDISYFLFYGSLLGAVRHNGFIPWDDDIDVVVPRKDYNKLVKIFNDSSNRYKLVSIHNNEEFTAPLAKIVDSKTRLIQKYRFKESIDLGVYIDVFILDGLPNDDKMRKQCMKKAKDLTQRWSISNSKLRSGEHSLFYDLAHYMYRLPIILRGCKHYLHAIDTFASRYDFYESEYVSNLSFTVIDFEYRREDFVPIRKDFEGHNFVIPKGYDRLLKTRYGDWQSLPEKKYQVSHHDFECYYLEDEEGKVQEQ